MDGDLEMQMLTVETMINMSTFNITVKYLKLIDAFLHILSVNACVFKLQFSLNI